MVVARKQDYYINEQLAYSLHVVCDFRAKLVGFVKKKNSFCDGSNCLHAVRLCVSGLVWGYKQSLTG